MQTYTYANGREICSKAADGRSAAAFPDVCWSPPPPPAGPVQIPYPNTTFAKDLTHGTRTIIICGTEVAQKDKSYFSTSTGDEPATYAFGKGINTGALKGKAYFTSWSMDVLVEGLNVARHQDLMTHNHASPGGNTPAHEFIDDAHKKTPCGDDLEAATRACAPDTEEDNEKDKEENKDKKYGRDRHASRSYLKKVGSSLHTLSDALKTKHGFEKDKSKDNGNTAWMEHCHGLWIKPYSGYKEQIKGFTDQLEAMRKDLASVTADVVKPMVEKVEKELLEKLGTEAAEKALKAGGRSAARWGVGAAGAAFFGVGAIVTETIATAWNIYDLTVTAYEGVQLAASAYKAITDVKQVMAEFRQALSSLDKLIAFAKENPQAAMAQAMSIFARLNPCARARRCILVPYGNTSTATSLGGKGCCPGQTGHHILPDEMMKASNCKKYSKYQAPTICVEGVNNSHGTHGMIHDKLLDQITDHKKKSGAKATLTYDQARNMGVESVLVTFPESRCNEDCLKAQLDKYYTGTANCKGPLPPLAGKAGQEDEIDAGSDPGNLPRR